MVAELSRPAFSTVRGLSSQAVSLACDALDVVERLTVRLQRFLRRVYQAVSDCRPFCGSQLARQAPCGGRKREVGERLRSRVPAKSGVVTPHLPDSVLGGIKKCIQVGASNRRNRRLRARSVWWREGEGRQWCSHL